MQHRLSIQNSCNTVYPRNMVCFRYKIVNTQHKGYDDYDDDNNSNNKLGSTGTITKSFTKYLNNVPGKCEIKKI